MAIQMIPRTAVKIGLSAARLPLTAAETLLRRQGDEEWPPTLVFEGFEASIKQVVGGLLRDETLVDEGRFTAAKVDRLRHAAELDTIAEQHRAQADAELEERYQADERQRAQAEERARERKAELARKAAADKRKAQANARKAEEAAAQAEAAQEQALNREERRARAKTVSAKQAAAKKERAALTKAESAEATQAALDMSKRSRAS
ncbi:MAG: hypothetical protein JWN46_1549 [Acidimicrobiales bacterium]|nr:hypothetical protein [Acidimicrobiales bacterium]